MIKHLLKSGMEKIIPCLVILWVNVMNLKNSCITKSNWKGLSKNATAFFSESDSGEEIVVWYRMKMIYYDSLLRKLV